ncbi:hypothetical protein [Neoaquamicrobium sediminum]|uniref:hypothetical protein n=1 Tax=Neoaquamicrobium sediminum TaxID=1849104 RepID=UPI001566184E|nr:hypothetical protein [Mesorhizobium sediminum]NRC54155.1 hypothetical protein [Mesorhizobium sediminum]
MRLSTSLAMAATAALSGLGAVFGGGAEPSRRFADVMAPDPAPKKKRSRSKAVVRHVSKMDDPAFRDHWGSHPGRNPRYNGGGNRYFERSRWLPHSGAKEAARYGARAN